MRFGMEDMRARALAALEEVVEQSKTGPVKRTLALRFTLAFLANFADDLAMFDWFWKSLADTSRHWPVSERERRAEWHPARCAVMSAFDRQWVI